MVGGTESPQEWISEEEKGIVLKFRESVLNKLPTEYLSKSEDDLTAFLLRWLRARNLNLNKAENMLINALEWRKENNLESVFDKEADPFIIKTYPWTFAGVDKQGHPVELCPMYEWDFRKLAAEKKLDEADFFARQFFEIMMKEIEAQNATRKPGQPPITQYVCISDVSGFSYGQVLNYSVMKKWFAVAAVYEAYYPEILYKCVVINCPYAFTVFLNMCKAFLAPKTVEKFACYATLEDWKKDMEDLVDPAILPEQYGGTRKEPLPPPGQLKYVRWKTDKNGKISYTPQEIMKS